MKYLWAIILLLSTNVLADTYTVNWTPPNQYEDQTPLYEQDLDFYTVFVNDIVVVYLDVIVGTWTADITVTQPGTHTLEMTVTDVNGMESGRSNMINFTVGPRTPMAPIVQTVVAQ